MDATGVYAARIPDKWTVSWARVGPQIRIKAAVSRPEQRRKWRVASKPTHGTVSIQKPRNARPIYTTAVLTSSVVLTDLTNAGQLVVTHLQCAIITAVFGLWGRIVIRIKVVRLVCVQTTAGSPASFATGHDVDTRVKEKRSAQLYFSFKSANRELFYRINLLCFM